MLATLFLFASSLFITADRFEESADHLFETLDVSEVRPGESIFLKASQLEEFFHRYHPAINAPYVLISHLTDESVPGKFSSYLDDPKILMWHGINWDGTMHPKMRPIPIGIANRKLEFGNLETLRRVREKNLAKEHLLYMNFTIQTFSDERWRVFKLFAKAPYCYRTGKKSFEGYLTDMAASKFVIAPRGAGLDTYRLWEALYVGSIPIVKSSSLDPLFEGLPVLIVDRWEEVNESFLEETYREFSNRPFSLEKLEFSFWDPRTIRLLDNKN
jgi:hypothetical protein